MTRVLVIDDDLMIVRLLQEHLSSEGFEVATATLAEEGFVSAVATRPDVILLDVMLPDATGFQTCLRLRQNAATQSIPIIMMTGTARFPNQQAIGKQLGANDYILKPFNVVEVGDKVRALVPRKEESLPIPPARSGPIESPLPAPDKVPYYPNNGWSVNAPHAFGNALVAAPPSIEPLKELAGADAGKNLLPFLVADGPAVQREPERPAAEALPKVIEPPAASICAPPAEDLTQEDVPADVGPPEYKTETAAPLPARTLLEIPASALVTSGVFTWGLFAAHLVLTIKGAALGHLPAAGIFRAASYAAGGWMLMLGLLVASAALFRLALNAKEAWAILGAAFIPIVLRTLIGFSGIMLHTAAWARWAASSAGLAPELFWLRPLDAFEILAVLIEGLLLQRLSGASLKKSLPAALLIALGWSLAGRGYFRPF